MNNVIKLIRQLYKTHKFINVGFWLVVLQGVQYILDANLQILMYELFVWREKADRLVKR